MPPTGTYGVETTEAAQVLQGRGQPWLQRPTWPQCHQREGCKTLNERTSALIDFARSCVRLPRSRVSVTDQVTR